VPLWIETPANPGFLPAIVSLSSPKFGVTNKLVNGSIRSGVFSYDSDRLDEMIPLMLDSAYKLSESQSWPNCFNKPIDAFTYIQEQSGMTVHPHIVLVPISWSDSKLKKWGGDYISESTNNIEKSVGITPLIYNKICRVVRSNITMPVFFSRPDFVGMYTQFIGGKSSIILHNVRNGLAFCVNSNSHVHK
jgi:hypothetical protein